MLVLEALNPKPPKPPVVVEWAPCAGRSFREAYWVWGFRARVLGFYGVRVFRVTGKGVRVYCLGLQGLGWKRGLGFKGPRLLLFHAHRLFRLERLRLSGFKR